MGFVRIWRLSYWHPRQALDEIAQLTGPRYGAAYVLARGLILALFFYLPLYLLEYQPITPAYLAVFDTPDYFLYAVFLWPPFALLSWVYLNGFVYVVLRLLGYPADIDQILNLGGLLNLTIGVALLLFDWLTIIIGFHSNAVFLGVAHILIADPWAIALTAIYYRQNFTVPVRTSVVLGVAVRLLIIPLALIIIRT